MGTEERRLIEIIQSIDRKMKEAEKLEWERDKILEDLKKLCICDLETPSVESILHLAKEKEAEAHGLRQGITDLVDGVVEKYGYLLDKE